MFRDEPFMEKPFHKRTEAFLPPGYRFHPTDEELIVCYLSNKVIDSRCCASAIGDIDLNKCEPWDLPEKAKMGEKEWYFFSLRDRKYPTGLRTNRATDAGYWKATGKDREVTNSRTGCLVGMKKTLVFYKGRAPKGEKTNWIMHEYRLEGESPLLHLSRASKDEWVVCRIFKKGMGAKKSISGSSYTDSDNQASLPPLLESPHTTCTEGAVDNEPYGLHRDAVSPDFPPSKQCHDFSVWDSQKKDITSRRSLHETVDNMGALARITPPACSLSRGQANSLLHMDFNQELEQPFAASGTSLPLSLCIPLQGSGLCASGPIVKALLEEYSFPGKQFRTDGYLGIGSSNLVRNENPGNWIGEGILECKRPIVSTQLHLPVNRLTDSPSEICGEDAQPPNIYSTFSQHPTEQAATSNGLQTLWTY